MKQINPIILNALKNNNNLITTAQVLQMGFSKQLLLNYVKAGLLERVRHGTYLLPDAWYDDMYTMMLRSERIIFSHDTALYLHGLSNRTPFRQCITLPSNTVVPGSIKNECNYFYVKPEWHKIGLTKMRTPVGNMVRCYDLERTICDYLRTRDRCNNELVIVALQNYAAYKGKDLNRLADYATTFKVNSDLQKYLSVLL